MKSDTQQGMSRSVEITIVVVLLALLAVMRLTYLDADPPISLSTSTDVYTDTASYTLFARYYVEQGEFNPFNDTRFVFFLKSSVTVVAIVVFKLFGVSMWSSNFVGFLFAFGSLLLFFLFVRRTMGIIPGLLFLLFAGLNYNLIFYGRMAFLEHAMTFFAFLALFFVTWFTGRWAMVAGGMALAVSMFFGKVFGLVFLFPFACLMLYQMRFENSDRDFIPPSLFAAGFAVVAVIWLFFSYLPLQNEVAGYLGEHSVALYGSPVAFNSVGEFLTKMSTFGMGSKLFPRMVAIAFLGGGFLIMILYHLSRRQSWRDRFGPFNSAHIFLAAMMIAYYGSLMIWNYRPLRYSLVLVYPFCAAAAVVLTMVWERRRAFLPNGANWLFYFFCWPVVLIVISQFTRKLFGHFGAGFSIEDYLLWFALAAVAITALIGYVIRQYPGLELPKSQLIFRLPVVVLVLVICGNGIGNYYSWLVNPIFTARDNSRDLGMVLSSDAVLSGPYAPALTLENGLGTITHMFGVSKPDPELFQNYPITHLLLDRPNETRAAKDYPEIFDSAHAVCTYLVGGTKVRLFRVAELTGNPEAEIYRPTLFEVAADLYEADSLEQAKQAGIAFVQRQPDSYYGHYLLGEVAESGELYEIAEYMYKKAVELSPTNHDLNARLATFYADRFGEHGDERDREDALAYFDRAILLAPTAGKLLEARNKLEDSDR